MSVDTSLRKVKYTCSAVADYAFTFRALTSAPTDIKCKLAVIATGVETDLTYTTNYTVAVNSNGVGGTVTLVTTYGSTHTLTVYRETTDLQASDYNDYNQFPADTLETDLDRRTIKSQEVAEDVARALKVSVVSTLSNITLPNPTVGRALVWSTGGTIINSTFDADSVSTVAIAAATSATTQATAASASASAASTSETNALASEIAAATSETTALSYKVSAATSSTTASSYSTTALTASTTAASHATTALTHSTTAASHATTALTHSTTASSHATTALTHSTTAASHATTALTHSTTASSHATTALTQSTLAGNYASTASTEAISAATSATSAIAAATSATTTAAGIKQHIRCTLPNPNDYFANVSRALNLVSALDAAITITNILCSSEIDPGTESTIALFYADSLIGTASPVYLSSTTTIAGLYTSGTVALTVPTTKCIYVAFAGTPDTNIKQIHWDITFSY